MQARNLLSWFWRVLELWNMFMQTTLSSPVPIYCVPQGALEYCQGSSNQQQATSNALHATNSIQSSPFSPLCTVIRALDELSSIANTNAIGWQIQMEFGSKYKWNSFTNAIWTRSPVGWELVWPPCRRSIVSPQRGAGIWTVRTGSCSLITLFASPAQYGVWCCALPSTAEQAAFRDCEVDAKQPVDAVERREQWMPSRAALPTKEPFFSLSRWQAGATRYPLPPLLFKAPSSSPHNIYQPV